jgi:hypothetical protein
MLTVDADAVNGGPLQPPEMYDDLSAAAHNDGGAAGAAGELRSLPARQNGAPCESAAHRFHQNEAAFFDSMVFKRLIERQRN